MVSRPPGMNLFAAVAALAASGLGVSPLSEGLVRVYDRDRTLPEAPPRPAPRPPRPKPVPPPVDTREWPETRQQRRARERRVAKSTNRWGQPK